MEFFRNPTGSSYRKRMASPWALSYSTRKTLKKCPRRFELDKLKGVDVFSEDENGTLQDNVDFAYGSSLAAGIQQCLINPDRLAVLFAAFVAWDAPLDAAKPEKKKSIAYVYAALEQFLLVHKQFLGNWELATINGKPAVELSGRIDLGNGYQYYLHIDGVLRHKLSGKFMVLELKTTGFNNIHPAQYQNSDQGLGYSIVLDAVTGTANSVYEVLYLVYKSSAREFEPMFFTKNRRDRAAWIRNILYDCQHIGEYREHGYFPQSDDGCFSYFRPCPYFEMCGMKNSSLTRYSSLEKITNEAILPTDFSFYLKDIIDIQLDAITC